MPKRKMPVMGLCVASVVDVEFDCAAATERNAEDRSLLTEAYCPPQKMAESSKGTTDRTAALLPAARARASTVSTAPRTTTP